MLLESLALGWLAGSVLASQLGAWTAVLAPLTGLLIALRCRGGLRPAAMAALGVLLTGAALAGGGWYRVHQRSASPTDASRFIDDGPTRLRGVVDGDRDVLLHSVELHLRVRAVEDDRGWNGASGTVLLRLPASADLQDGDLVEVAGKLRRPTSSESFDYRTYLAQQGVYAVVDYPSTKRLGRNAGPPAQHLLVLLRERLDSGMHAILPEPEASLGAGLVFGTSRVRDPVLTAELRSTNADMIAVATGFNVTLVGLTALEGLAPLVGRRQAALAGLLAMLVYAIVLGFYPSVLRATIMTGAVLCASLVGRPYSGVRLLLLACAGMVAFDPAALTSISFPLSLSATGAVVWLLPPLQGWARRCLRLSRDSGPGRALAAGPLSGGLVTVCAMAGSAPAVLAVTHRVSVGSIPSNLFLFWLLPFLMAGAGTAALAAAVSHAAALVVAPIAYVLLFAMLAVVHLGASIPGADIPVPSFGKGAALGTYVLVLCFSSTRLAPAMAEWLADRAGELLALRPREVTATVLTRVPALLGRDARQRWVVAVAAAPLACAAAVSVPAAVWVNGSAQPPEVRVTYLDVGQGVATLVQAGSQRVLIDGGPAGDGTVRALDRTLPPWQRSLSLIVVTQRSADHVGGLGEVVQRYHVGAVLDASSAAAAGRNAPPEAAWLDWQRAQASARLTRLSRRPLTGISVGSAAIGIDAASPAGSTRLTPVATVVLTLGGRSLLLAGDQTASLDADVRRLPGREFTPPPSPPAILLLAPAPAIAAPAHVPSGFGHPLVYSTTANGDVRLTVSAHAISVHVQRGPALGLAP